MGKPKQQEAPPPKRDMQGTQLVPHPRTGKLVHPHVVERWKSRQEMEKESIRSSY